LCWSQEPNSFIGTIDISRSGGEREPTTRRTMRRSSAQRN